jgi:DNA-binding CsgD family transcriptional regulator
MTRSRSLTDRELAVVRLISMGRTSAEVAGELDIAPGTVDAHVRKAVAKTGTGTRSQLVRRYKDGEL